MLVYGECECFADVVCLCHPVAMLRHDQFVNAGRGCRRPYRRGILQSRSHNCIYSLSVSFCLPHPVAVSAFMSLY